MILKQLRQQHVRQVFIFLIPGHQVLAFNVLLVIIVQQAQKILYNVQQVKHQSLEVHRFHRVHNLQKNLINKCPSGKYSSTLGTTQSLTCLSCPTGY